MRKTQANVHSPKVLSHIFFKYLSHENLYVHNNNIFKNTSGTYYVTLAY